ncbi:MAG: winged helix-turn-helix transcriptional regulator [Candidatus Taylorbacteria bacterium]|nr:winged helix-turn-helix transcriptional regulator [Candidatus Taylorbacteria bacterium]
MIKLERQLKAVANKRRLAILAFLKKKKVASVGAVAENIKLSFTSTSKHLLILSAAEILEKEQVSLQMFYKITNLQVPVIKYLISVL